VLHYVLWITSITPLLYDDDLYVHCVPNKRPPFYFSNNSVK